MEDAQARRERLKALKQAAALAEAGDAPAADEQQAAADAAAAAPGAAAAAADAAADKPVLKFRNYVVRDEKIEHEKIAPAQPPRLEEPQLGTRPEEADEEELLASVAPKKANWDLKREVEPRLAKLERRTQRALVEIMLEEEQSRLAQEGGVAD